MVTVWDSGRKPHWQGASNTNTDQPAEEVPYFTFAGGLKGLGRKLVRDLEQMFKQIVKLL